MSLLARLFGPDGARAVDRQRWVVLDVETSGLDTRRDELLAVAALALHFDDDGRPRIALHDSFETVLQRDGAGADKHNILVHGIGVGAQRTGAPAHEALTAFERWIDRAPLLAWHAAFDRAMIGRALRHALRRPLRNPWLDLAPVAAALHPGVAARSLDDWLGHFGIDCALRHQAAADTLASAELLLRLWPRARASGCASWEGLVALDRQQRWFSRR